MQLHAWHILSVMKWLMVKPNSFGAEYIIPKALDQRLIMEIAPAVAKAAMDSGIATRPIEDFKAYRQKLSEFVYNSAFIMKPVFAQAKAAPNKRIVFCEGEDERVLRAVQIVVDEGLAFPLLVGRTEDINKQIQKLGLRIRAGQDFTLIDQDNLAIMKNTITTTMTSCADVVWA
jgi:malate dehydrogenase (oxaloacetate-decarboxylating)(NADP+)